MKAYRHTEPEDISDRIKTVVWLVILALIATDLILHAISW